jgi:lipopolysaccharide exporter
LGKFKIVKNYLSEKFIKSSFSRNILTLLTGSSISQIIPIVISPLLTRIYTPEDFGLLAIFTSITGVLSVISCGRYELAIMLPKTKAEATAVAFLSLIISLFFCIILLILALYFGPYFSTLLNNEEIQTWLIYVPFFVFLFSLYQILNYWNNKQLEYKVMSFALVGQSSGQASSNLLLGLLNVKPGGLFFSLFIGKFISILILFCNSYKQFELSLVNRKSLKQVLISYSDFPLKSSWSIFFNLMSNQLPLVLIGGMFGVHVLGMYAIVLRVLNTPLMFIGKAFSQVFYQESQNQESNKLQIFYKSMANKLFKLILIPMLLLFLLSEDFFSIIFGQEWREAGVIVKYFIVFFSIRFVFSPLSTLFLTKRKLNLEIIFNIIFFITQISSLYVGNYLGSYYYSFLLMGISGSVMFIILGIILYKISKIEVTN